MRIVPILVPRPNTLPACSQPDCTEPASLLEARDGVRVPLCPEHWEAVQR